MTWKLLSCLFRLNLRAHVGALPLGSFFTAAPLLAALIVIPITQGWAAGAGLPDDLLARQVDLVRAGLLSNRGRPAQVWIP